jgi:hypothetical protein
VLAFGHVLGTNGHDLVEGLLILDCELLRRDLAAVAALLEEKALTLRLKSHPNVGGNGVADSAVVLGLPLVELLVAGLPLGHKGREAEFSQAVDLAVGLLLVVCGELPKLLREGLELGSDSFLAETPRLEVNLVGVPEITALLGLHVERDNPVDSGLGNLGNGRRSAQAKSES